MESPQVSFKQVVSRGCGLDVHKKVVVATIDGEGIKKQTREFGTVTSSLKELIDWLLEHRVTHVVMESTSVFWKPVCNVLEPAELTVLIVNAAQVKYVPGHKTDKQDSAWLCKLLLAGLLKPSYIPAKEQRELRDLTRYRTTLIQSNASNKNRIIRILEDANIKLSSVLSSTSGVVGTKLIDKLCEGKEITMQDVEDVYHKMLEASKEEIYEACQGFITEHHVYMLQIIRQEIAATLQTIEKLNQRIKTVLSPYENALELLKKVPGISSKSVKDLVAEIGLDMSVFPAENHLSSWAGMAPGNSESAGKKKRTNNSGKQASKISTDRNCLGGNKDKKHILSRKIS
jgi:transposase